MSWLGKSCDFEMKTLFFYTHYYQQHNARHIPGSLRKHVWNEVGKGNGICYSSASVQRLGNNRESIPLFTATESLALVYAILNDLKPHAKRGVFYLILIWFHVEVHILIDRGSQPCSFLHLTYTVSRKRR